MSKLTKITAKLVKNNKEIANYHKKRLISKYYYDIFMLLIILRKSINKII